MTPKPPLTDWWLWRTAWAGNLAFDPGRFDRRDWLVTLKESFELVTFALMRAWFSWDRYTFTILTDFWLCLRTGELMEPRMCGSSPPSSLDLFMF